MSGVRSRRHAEHGLSLLEVLVVLSLLGVAAGVVGIAHFRVEGVAPPDEAAERLAAARAEALATGRSVTVRIERSGALYWATVRPDGGVLADTDLAVDRLTGKPGSARGSDAR